MGVIVTATAARAAVLWGLAPILVRFRFMAPISHRMNAALLWGGLRLTITGAP
jgi:CPA1 family monovalent cation:H+ antiporter